MRKAIKARDGKLRRLGRPPKYANDAQRKQASAEQRRAAKARALRSAAPIEDTNDPCDDLGSDGFHPGTRGDTLKESSERERSVDWATSITPQASQGQHGHRRAVPSGSIGWTIPSIRPTLSSPSRQRVGAALDDGITKSLTGDDYRRALRSYNKPASRGPFYARISQHDSATATTQRWIRCGSFATPATSPPSLPTRK